MVIQSILTRKCKPHGQDLPNPTKYKESAKIAQQKLAQLFDMLPMLKAEIAVENYGTDYIKIIFHNKSSFVVVTPLNSSRGQRATVGIIDEFR